MQVANRTTRVAPELVMDKWRFRVRKTDGLSLESRESREGRAGREGRDGDDVAHGELGHGGMLEGMDLLVLILHALALYTTFSSHRVSLPGIVEVPTLQLPLPRAGGKKPQLLITDIF